MSKLEKIELHSWVDVQIYMEKLYCRFSATLSDVIVELLNFEESEGGEQVEVEISFAILQKSYQVNPAMLAKALKPRIKFPHIVANRSGQMVKLLASTEKVQTVFLKSLREKLNENKIVMIPWAEMPPAHQEQPAVLAFRLRREGFDDLDYAFIGDKILFTHNKKQTTQKQTT